MHIVGYDAIKQFELPVQMKHLNVGMDVLYVNKYLNQQKEYLKIENVKTAKPLLSGHVFLFFIIIIIFL